MLERRVAYACTKARLCCHFTQFHHTGESCDTATSPSPPLSGLILGVAASWAGQLVTVPMSSPLLSTPQLQPEPVLGVEKIGNRPGHCGQRGATSIYTATFLQGALVAPPGCSQAGLVPLLRRAVKQREAVPLPLSILSPWSVSLPCLQQDLGSCHQ